MTQGVNAEGIPYYSLLTTLIYSRNLTVSLMLLVGFGIVIIPQSIGDEEIVIRVGGVKSRLNGVKSRICDGPDRKAVALVGVVIFAHGADPLVDVG